MKVLRSNQFTYQDQCTEFEWIQIAKFKGMEELMLIPLIITILIVRLEHNIGPLFLAIPEAAY